MPKVKLSDRGNKGNVFKLKCPARGEAAIRYHDWGQGAQPGFHVAAHASGVRTYHVEWRDERGRKQAMKLGRVDEMSLGDAYEAARGARVTAHGGIDPRGRDSTKFEDVVADWSRYKIDAKARVAESTEDVKAWVLSCCDGWHGKPIAKLTYHDIRDVLAMKCDEGHKPAANALYRHLRSLFKYAWRHRGRTKLQENPMLDVELPWSGEQPRAKPWYRGELADDVLRAVWAHASAIAAKQPDQSKFIKLAVLTGKRGRCVHEMQWDHIDATGYWRPSSRSKHKHNSPIPLPALARSVIGKPQTKGRVMPDDFGRRFLAQCVRGVPDDFHWHGLRHIMATKLEEELNISPWLARMVLDRKVFHDVHADYVHADRRKQMLDVLEQWAAYVTRLVYGEGVVAIG